MNESPAYGRLLNAGGELIAEGPCWLNEQAGEATMEPERTPGIIQRQRGQLQLELDSGRLFPVSDKPMILRLRAWGGSAGQDARRKLYRLRLLSWGADGVLPSGRIAPANEAQEVLPKGRTVGAEHAQEAEAAGAAGEGSPAPRHVGGPRFEETPAARY